MACTGDGTPTRTVSAEEQYLWIRKRAEAECLAAVETVQAADRAAAVIIEAQAFHAPLPVFPEHSSESHGGSNEGAGSFLDGAVRGDFSDNDSWSAIGGHVGIGLVPIAGQVADGRDIVAAIKDKAWGRLPLVALGVVPGLDFLKGRKAFSAFDHGGAPRDPAVAAQLDRLGREVVAARRPDETWGQQSRTGRPGSRLCDHTKLGPRFGHLPHLDSSFVPRNMQIPERIPDENGSSITAIEVFFGIVDQDLDDSAKSERVWFLMIRVHSRASRQLCDG